MLSKSDKIDQLENVEGTDPKPRIALQSFWAYMGVQAEAGLSYVTGKESCTWISEATALDKNCVNVNQ
jgi:hypothetical protein